MIDDPAGETPDLRTFNERRIFEEMGIDEHPDGSVIHRLLDKRRLVLTVLDEAEAGFQRCVIEKRLNCFPKTKQSDVDYVVRPMIGPIEDSWRCVLPDGRLMNLVYTLILPEELADQLTEICKSVCEDQKHW